MAVFTAATWLELEEYLASLSGSDLDIEINLSMAQAEASPDGAAKVIDFPADVKTCILSSADRDIIYKMRITTARTTYFELTIRNLTIKMQETNQVIDIAAAEHVGAASGENYNKLNFDGINTIANFGNGTQVHVGQGTGLYIDIMENSNTFLGVEEQANLAAAIGGKQSESGGNMYIFGKGILRLESFRGACIGGGGGTDTFHIPGSAGNGGNIEIYDSVEIIIDPGLYSAVIGGGSTMRGTAGSSGKIKIYGHAKITGEVGLTTAIGGGSCTFGDSKDADSIDIYDDAVINVTCAYTAIGGGSSVSGNGGNVGSINIYGNAKVTTTTNSSGTGIGGGRGDAVGGNAGNIKIYDNASVTATTPDGVGIGACKNGDGTLTGTGTIEISTTGLITVTKNDNDDLAIGGGPACVVNISGDVPMDIPGGIGGYTFTIIGRKIIVDELIYKTADYTGSLTFDDGYIVINKEGHMQDPVNRGDYFVIQLTNEDGTPYTLPVRLESKSDINTFQVYEAAEAVNEITPNADGKIQIYISSGDYYLASSTNNYLRSNTFSVDAATEHDNPSLPLVMSFSGGQFEGNLTWYRENTHGGGENVVVSLYNEDKSRSSYSTMTDSDGAYLINNVDAGNYYVGFSNVPHDYIFVVNDESLVMKTGVTKIAYEISKENPVEIVNADISYYNASKGTTGIPGIPGAPGKSFPSSSIDMIKLEGQVVEREQPVVLGEVVEGNGNDMYYSLDRNAIILNNTGTYMINFKANASYIDEHTNEDYLALQLKQGNEYLKHGFSYIWNDGMLYGSVLVRNTGYGGSNELQVVNVGSKKISIDNLGITIFKAS
ncbi:MAG: SdrD B-like domain-containing protein [Clostridium sp.]|nr:SdrD B-like domain-containing protein [Clostridium sp.]